MTTQQLECFIRVADKLNFTKAAQEMFLTTPTVTHHIKSLEEELGATLFIRTPKMVQLTDAGAEFYGDAKDILNRINLSSKKIANVVSQSLSYIRIGCTSNAELKALKPALKELRKCMPDIYPMLFLRDYSRLKTMFESGHIDIMLVTKDMIENTDCTFKPIKNMKSYALISDDYNKTTEDNKDLHSMSAISFDDLKGHCLLLLNQRLIPFTQEIFYRKSSCFIHRIIITLYVRTARQVSFLHNVAMALQYCLNSALIPRLITAASCPLQTSVKYNTE